MTDLPKHATDFYGMVPKGAVSNLMFRRAILRRVLAEAGFVAILQGGAV